MLCKDGTKTGWNRPKTAKNENNINLDKDTRLEILMYLY